MEQDDYEEEEKEELSDKEEVWDKEEISPKYHLNEVQILDNKIVANKGLQMKNIWFKTL